MENAYKNQFSFDMTDVKNLLANIRKYFASEIDGTLDLTGLFDQPTSIDVNFRNSGQIFRQMPKCQHLIAPNFIINNAWCIGECPQLRSIRIHSVNIASEFCSKCPLLSDVYFDGMSSQDVIHHAYFPWSSRDDTSKNLFLTFHCNDGKKVFYDHDTKMWMISDDGDEQGKI